MSPLDLALLVPQLDSVGLSELEEIRDELGEAEWEEYCSGWLEKLRAEIEAT